MNPIEFDIFVISDAFFAGFSLFTFIFFQLFGEDWALNPQLQSYLNYMSVTVITLGMVKFGLMFLVVEKFSILMISLKEMLMSTNSILVIMLIYMLLYSQFGITEYADMYPSYKDIITGMRMAFDSYMASYDWTEFLTNKPSEQSKKLMYYFVYIVQLFVANILLLNFMIAILSDKYEVMNELGSFHYKCYLYTYCERYMIAFQVPEYGELVVHSPPFNGFCILLIPILPLLSRESAIALSDRFSKFIFWIENIAFILIFFIFELFMSPVIFFITYYNIVMSTPGFFTLIFYLLLWTVIGFGYLLFIALADVKELMSLLYMHNGCKFEAGE